MIARYKGRLLTCSAFIIGMSIWNFFFYFVSVNQYNPWLDLPFSFFFICGAWWIGSYFDKSNLLVWKLSKSEEEYKKLLETTNYLFDNLNQIIYQTDVSGKFTLLNPAWENITGFSVAESIGRTMQSYVYHEDQELHDRFFAETLSTQNTVIQEEVRLRKKDGGFVWVEINSKLSYSSTGKSVTSIGTITDITEWKNSELELLQLNENLAIQSDKLSVVAHMSAAIAHEVRNPLTSISGFIQLLQEQRHLKKEYIDVIFAEIERIELVLSEMLLLSKPQIVSLKKFDIVKTLDYVVALISTKANMNSIEIQMNKGNHSTYVYGEENQLKQVFINIIKNAIEAMQNGGKVHINLISDCDFVSIYISDTGCGIPKETLENLGQPFYTTKEKGTGLGLTTCFKIIENHRGKIHISSQVGIGSTFEVVLPIEQNELKGLVQVV